MVQESIVEYINSQMRAGVPRDTIKTTLTGAGWQAADVEDTLKKIELAKVTQPMAVGAAAAAKPASGMASSGPQTIKVSDLVSSAPMSKSPLTGSSPMSSVSTTAKPGMAKAAETFPAESLSASKPRVSRAMLITGIILVVIILAVGGFAGFLFMQNNSLNAQLASLSGQSSGVNSQLSALQAQVAASTTALTAQVSTLSAANQELQTELSFFAVPTSTASSATTTTATISGTVAAGKTSYVITATYGAKIVVANSKSAAVIAALTPLLGTPAASTTTTSSSTTASSTTASSTAPAAPVAPTTAQFTGTYVPGSDMITLTAVNGTSL